MVQKIFPLIILIALIGCTSETGTLDYFGQNPPDTIPVIFARNIVSVQGRFEHGISFSPNGREMTFGILNKNDFSGTIFYSKKVNSVWDVPALFEPLKNESVFLPYFSPDGESLIYTQSKPDTNNGFTDIWIIHKKGEFWINPQRMMYPLSSPGRESTACMTSDKSIYFSSNREGNGLADLYFSSMENGAYLKAEKLNAVNTVRDEESIFISPDETYLIFSRYATNQNGPDLYVSYRNTAGNWIEPVPADITINSGDWERRPFVTIDNQYLFFTRLSIGENGLTESDIYWVSTKKLFKPFVYNPLSDTTLSCRVKIEIKIPDDYFKDIDDKHLELKADLKEIEELEFDADKKVLSGTPVQAGEFDVIFSAVDAYSNKTADTIKLTVKK